MNWLKTERYFYDTWLLFIIVVIRLLDRFNVCSCVYFLSPQHDWPYNNVIIIHLYWCYLICIAPSHFLTQTAGRSNESNSFRWRPCHSHVILNTYFLFRCETSSCTVFPHRSLWICSIPRTNIEYAILLFIDQLRKKLCDNKSPESHEKRARLKYTTKIWFMHAQRWRHNCFVRDAAPNDYSLNGVIVADAVAVAVFFCLLSCIISGPTVVIHIIASRRSLCKIIWAHMCICVNTMETTTFKMHIAGQTVANNTHEFRYVFAWNQRQFNRIIRAYVALLEWNECVLGNWIKPHITAISCISSACEHI